MCKRRSVIAMVILMLLGGVSSPGKPESDVKLARHFTVNWTMAGYTKAVRIYNPKVSSTQPETSEQLSISLRVEISDPKLILGISREPEATEIVDDLGRPIPIPQTRPSARPLRQGYEGLRYSPRHRTPPRTWMTRVRSFLEGSSNRPGAPELVMELQPSQMTLQFAPGLLPDNAKAISHIKGCFRALVAESIEHVDVPFEPNENWVQVTPNAEIRVRQAQCTESSYEYHIETYPAGGGPGPFRSVGEALPERLVVGREFIDQDGKPTAHGGPQRTLHAPLGGHGSGSGRDIHIAKIRYLIAVNPAHRKVSFEVRDIPLPKP